jgi:hypothetical protein
MGGTSPVRRLMACPHCGNSAVNAMLRHGDGRSRPPKPASLVMDNHFPPGKRDLCGASEQRLGAALWPQWAKTALTKHQEKQREKGKP